MRDGKTKKSKLSWSKKMVNKLLNLRCKNDDFLADAHPYAGGEVEFRTSSFSEREPCALKRSKTEKFNQRSQHGPRGIMNLDHPRIIDVQNYSVFSATWNVAGRSPPNNLSLEDWLHASPPADIYVLGFQEIVPLNAGNVLGSENNGPAKKWLALIRRTLNNLLVTGGGGGCHTPSPVPQPIVEMNADFEGSSRQKNSAFFHCRSFQTTSSSRMDNDPSISQPRLDRRFGVCDRVIFGHRPSDYDSSNIWGHRPSDYSRASDYSWPSDYSRWGSSDDDNGIGDSPMSNGGSASKEHGKMMLGHSRYSLVASKQMVGMFLTVWVRSELRDHVKNMKVSCIGRGLMGYLGNKGSISVSMLVHETSFCFICSHLTSGQKEGDELRRNFDVMEILKKTRFPRVHGVASEKSPETILDHDRIIWLGDLNYRIALPHRSAKALIEMQNWRALLENDQLQMEQKRGRIFVGWHEGKIYFPPTYKYFTNSDRYAGDDMCDRILWYVEGLQQLSYVRGESRFSDHRPVYGMFMAEVESTHSWLKKTTSYSRSRIEVEELLPYSSGYTDLNFF